MSSYDQPNPIAMNATIMGIILLPIGSIFALVFLYQSISERKQNQQRD